MKDLSFRTSPAPCSQREGRSLSHADLVRLGVEWLSKRCAVVRPEFKHQNNIEIPDVIGWAYNGQSCVIECKVSREDFVKDKKKPHRQHAALGMGHTRYYLVPDRLSVKPEETGRWGLLVVRNGRVFKRVKSMPFDINHKAERHLLVSAAREPTWRVIPNPKS